MNTNKDNTPNWSLSDLVDTSNPSAIEETIRRFEESVKTIEGWRIKLTSEISGDDFKSFLSELEKEESLSSILSGFAEMQFDADTQNQKYLALKDRVTNIRTEAENKMVFFTLWWIHLDEANASRLMEAAAPENYWLHHERLLAPHVRSEEVEQIMNLKNSTGREALLTLYSLIVNSFKFNLEIDGKKLEMTEGELNAYRRSPDPKIREACYKEFLRVYNLSSNQLGHIYKSLIQDRFNENIKTRGYSSPISVRNLSNNIPDSAVETLLSTIRNNAGVFQKYFILKAKLLGVPKLRRCDLYAPLPVPDKTYTFQEALDLVFRVFGEFDPEFEKQARKVLEDNHLDAQVREGKHNGAFCASILPSLSAWVSLSFQGKILDVETLAHELGHAIHDGLASGHPIFQNHPCIPLAETASTFGEMLLNSKLLEIETDVQVKRYLLARMIEGAYASIGRQGFFAIWEIEANKLVSGGSELEDLNNAYLANLKEQFGDSLELDEEFKLEWTTIPHFYEWPLYVYGYSFGELLVHSLYRMYRAQGDSFKPKMFALLSAGGSKSPENILTDIGFDIADQKLWQNGYDAISEEIDRLEKMA